MDARIFVALVLPSMPTLRHCPGQGMPMQDGSSEIGVPDALSGHPDWQSICYSSMSRYVNRLDMGRAMWESVTQLLNVR